MTNFKMLGLGLLVAALALTGCSNSSDTQGDGTAQGSGSGGETGHGHSHEHGHSHDTGPNGGVVFDLGKYHAEFTVDHPKKECTVLVLGDDGKTTTPVAASELTLTTKATKTADGTVVEPMTIKLLPQNEEDGKAAKFVGTDPGIANVADFEGTVLGVIDGKPSQGEFSEVHSGHSH